MAPRPISDDRVLPPILTLACSGFPSPSSASLSNQQRGLGQGVHRVVCITAPPAGGDAVHTASIALFCCFAVSRPRNPPTQICPSPSNPRTKHGTSDRVTRLSSAALAWETRCRARVAASALLPIPKNPRFLFPALLPMCLCRASSACPHASPTLGSRWRPSRPPLTHLARSRVSWSLTATATRRSSVQRPAVLLHL